MRQSSYRGEPPTSWQPPKTGTLTSCHWTRLIHLANHRLRYIYSEYHCGITWSWNERRTDIVTYCISKSFFLHVAKFAKIYRKKCVTFFVCVIFSNFKSWLYANNTDKNSVYWIFCDVKVIMKIVKFRGSRKLLDLRISTELLFCSFY